MSSFLLSSATRSPPADDVVVRDGYGLRTTRMRVVFFLLLSSFSIPRSVQNVLEAGGALGFFERGRGGGILISDLSHTPWEAYCASVEITFDCPIDVLLVVYVYIKKKNRKIFSSDSCILFKSHA